MKKLIYENEEIATISEKVAEDIIEAKNKRQPHFNFKGESLILNRVQVRKIKQEIVGEKRIYEMTTFELKEIIGDFERIYKEHRTGEVIHNEIIGDEHEGIIQWALEIEVITRKEANGRGYWFIVSPEGIEWERKRKAMRELWSRRKFAEEQCQVK